MVNKQTVSVVLELSPQLLGLIVLSILAVAFTINAFLLALLKKRNEDRSNET